MFGKCSSKGRVYLVLLPGQGFGIHRGMVLDWLALFGLASLASAWRVSSAAATTTATTPEEAATTTAAARSAATVVISASSGVVAAAEETSHAEARLAKPSQASQVREGLTNGFGYFVMPIQYGREPFLEQGNGMASHRIINSS